MRRHLLAAILAVTCARTALAQDSIRVSPPALREPVIKPEWFTKRDVRNVGLGVLAIGLLSLADEPIAKEMERAARHNSSLHSTTSVLGRSGDPGALIVSSTLYLAGTLAHKNGLADASKHAAVAIALTTLTTQPMRWGFGRARPNIAEGDAYIFHPFSNLKSEYNSMPSGHASAAFALAAAFSSELKRTHPRAARFASPALYGVAGVVGAARVYDNRHWLSDVVTGALIGEVTARRIVKVTHKGM